MLMFLSTPTVYIYVYIIYQQIYVQTVNVGIFVIACSHYICMTVVSTDYTEGLNM